MNGKVAVITGSTSGIGLGIAERLGAQGCHLVLNGFGETEQIRALQHRLKETYGVQVSYIPVDLSVPAQSSQLITKAEDEFGHVDILVNNAGIQHVAPVEDFPIDQWQKVIDINLTTPFALMKAVLPRMRERGWGRIVNIASVHGLIASAQKSAYVSAKHGLIGLTKVVALETARTPITCNAICPGWVLTPLVEKQIQERVAVSGRSFEEEKKALLLEKQPSGEFASVEQLGGLVVYLCSPDAAQIRGAAMTVDGGWTIQ